MSNFADIATLVNIPWEIRKPIALTPCPLCGEMAGYVAIEDGISQRNENGMPHLCKATEERLAGQFGPITELVEKVRLKYRGASAIDMKIELAGWYHVYEKMGIDVADGYGDQSDNFTAWTAQAYIEALREEIAREEHLHGVRLAGVDFTPWRERLSRAMEVPIRDIFDSLGGKRKKTMAHCILPSHTGVDKNPSMKLYEERNRFVCFTCNETGGAMDLIMKTNNLTLKEAVLWTEQMLGL